MPRADCSSNTIRDSISRCISVSAGPALRARLAARAASVRAYARPASRPAPAWYWKKSAFSSPGLERPQWRVSQAAARAQDLRHLPSRSAATGERVHAVCARRSQVRSGQRAEQPRGALARARGGGDRDQPGHRVQRAVPSEVRRVVQLAAPVPERAQANKEEQNVRSTHGPSPQRTRRLFRATQPHARYTHSRRTVCERRPGPVWPPVAAARRCRARGAGCGCPRPLRAAAGSGPGAWGYTLRYTLRGGIHI